MGKCYYLAKARSRRTTRIVNDVLTENGQVIMPVVEPIESGQLMLSLLSLIVVCYLVQPFRGLPVGLAAGWMIFFVVLVLTTKSRSSMSVHPVYKRRDNFRGETCPNKI